MEEKVNLAVVGAFVLVLGTALVAGVLWLSSGKSYRVAYDTYQTYMTESVAGLNLNAPVRYRGVEVGRVVGIALAPGNVEEVRLTLAIERGTPIKADTVAVLETQGLTGIAFVNLQGGSRNSPPLHKQPGAAYPVIAAGPSLMKRLDAAITALLTNLNTTSERLNALLNDGNQRAVRQTLADLATLSHTLASRSPVIDSGLVDAAHTMKNAARLTAELTGLAARIQRSTDAFDRMAAQLGGAGAAASRTLPEIQQLAAQLRDLAASLQRVSGELEQNPSLLLRGKAPSPRGPGE